MTLRGESGLNGPELRKRQKNGGYLGKAVMGETPEEVDD